MLISPQRALTILVSSTQPSTPETLLIRLSTPAQATGSGAPPASVSLMHGRHNPSAVSLTRVPPSSTCLLPSPRPTTAPSQAPRTAAPTAVMSSPAPPPSRASPLVWDLRSSPFRRSSSTTVLLHGAPRPALEASKAAPRLESISGAAWLSRRPMWSSTAPKSHGWDGRIRS
jgi:hypothetical protein